jgi:hypothetical protein
MSKIIEKKKVTVVDYVYYWRSLDDMEKLMSYLNSISETSIDSDVRKKISEIIVSSYTGFKEGFIENRLETAVKPKNIAKNIADKIPIEIKWKGKEA